MKHAASRELYAYWEERRGTRPAPERAEIEPGAIRGVLSDAFILGARPRRRSSAAARRHAAMRAVRPRVEGGIFHRIMGGATADRWWQACLRSWPTNAWAPLPA